jgi:hypothetical protein
MFRSLRLAVALTSFASLAPVATAAGDLDSLRPWWTEFTNAQRSGLLVWHRGQIVAEWYGGGLTADSRFEIGSLRKSFNSALVGAKGLDVSARAFDVWPEIHTHTGREKDKAITLHQLLSATSGWKTERNPGEEFLYNNAAFTAAERVTARLLKLPRDEVAPEIDRLFKAPLGANSWRFYHWDRPFNPADRSTGPKLSIDSNLRDFLRWGVLWHNRGKHESRALIPEAWVLRATSIVNPHLPGPHYGYNWFVNADGKLWPDLPRDAYGHSGSGTFKPDDAKSRSYLFVCPSRELVVACVVAKETHPEDFLAAGSASARELLTLVVRALPARAVTERVLIDDPLAGGSTRGELFGGRFTVDGYQPREKQGHILYRLAVTVIEGYAEFQVRGMTREVPKGSDHAFFAMYDGRGLAEPVSYWADYKENFFRWNAHWRENRGAFKCVVQCAAPTPERLHARRAVFPREDDAPRDWREEPTGQSVAWDPTRWHTIRLEWQHRGFRALVDGQEVWAVHGAAYEYAPIEHRIWLGSAPGYAGKYENDLPEITYRHFKLVAWRTAPRPSP